MAHFTHTKLAKPTHFNFATDVIDYWAMKQPKAQAMYWVSQDMIQARSLRYTYFQRQSHRIAVMLRDLGIKQGQTVVMILPRVPEWWEIAVAAIRSGIVICPATTLLVDKDIEFRVLETGATAFIGDATSVRKFQNVRLRCPGVKHVIHVDQEITSLEASVVNFHSTLQTVPQNAIFDGPKTKSSDRALIYFTSGTSGPPKMVQHNQVSYPLAHTLTGRHWLQLEPGKLYWNLSEQGWAKAAWSFFSAWNCGASLFVHDDSGAFKPLQLLEVLHHFPITTLCAPPTIYRQLVLQESKKYLAKYPPHALSHCTGAGEPLNDSVIDEWQKMTGMEIYDGYGQTETILTCGNAKGTPIRPGSMGKPIPGVPLKVISNEGTECEPAVEGDIAILVEGHDGNDRTAFFGMFDGYLKRDGTLNQRISRLGSRLWYLTGDRATRDEDGYFWFVGRADDVINSSGYRIGPFEVESTLKLHPAIAESAVVASPDPSRGEVVKAFVVLKSEYQTKGDTGKLIKELQEFCKEHAAPYKYPRKIQVVDASFLPKTISGKIKRNELKAMEWKKDGRSKL